MAAPEKYDRLAKGIHDSITAAAIQNQLFRLVNAKAIENPTNWARKTTALEVAERALEKMRDPLKLHRYWKLNAFERGAVLSGGRQEVDLVASLAIMEVLYECSAYHHNAT